MIGVPMTVPSGVICDRQSGATQSDAGPDVQHRADRFHRQDGGPIGNLPPAFQIQPAFTLRTASLYFGNLRDRWGPDFNLAMVKSTQIRERLSLEFRADALNVLNHPLWGGDPVIVTTSPNFGQVAFEQRADQRAAPGSAFPAACILKVRL